MNHKEEYKKSPLLVDEIFDMVLGEHIGSGSFRDVFHYSVDPSYVIKVENSKGFGENWAEWRIWNAVQHTEYAKWFAPTKSISENGKVLMQKKTKSFYSRSDKSVPDKIPAFFTDVKPDNFGWIGNQLVCHDYSHCLEMFSSFGLTKKMQPTKSKLK